MNNDIFDWGQRFYAHSLGYPSLNKAGVNEDKITLKDYVQKFLIPTYTIIAADQTAFEHYILEGDYYKENFEDAYNHITAFETVMDIQTFIVCMTTAHVSRYLWYRLLPDIAEFSINCPPVKTEDDLKNLLLLYYKKFRFLKASVGLEARITMLPMDDSLEPYSELDIETPVIIFRNEDSINIGDLTVKHMITVTPPASLDDSIRESLKEAIKEWNIPEDLLSTSVVYDVDTKQNIYVNILSPKLPPYDVYQIMRILPASLVSKYKNPYEAVYHYLELEPDKVISNNAKKFLETMCNHAESSFVDKGQPTLEECVKKLKAEGYVILRNEEYNELKNRNTQTTEPNVIEFLKEHGFASINSLSDLCMKISKKDIDTYINEHHKEIVDTYCRNNNVILQNKDSIEDLDEPYFKACKFIATKLRPIVLTLPVLQRADYVPLVYVYLILLMGTMDRKDEVLSDVDRIKKDAKPEVQRIIDGALKYVA